MNYLRFAKENEISREISERQSCHAMQNRNYYIGLAFKDGGSSQKEIANALGLSESRVKKIIGELKKQDKK